METLDKKDVTDRAVSGGWTLPDGWTVTADISPDHDTNPSADYDCYTSQDISAWRNDDWLFVVIGVFVQDDNGRDWGRSIMGGCEHGWITSTDEHDNVTGGTYVDALADPPGEYSPIREYDMIAEALRDASAELERFGTPIIVEPTTNFSGL